jgi:hypothetical protein
MHALRMGRDAPQLRACVLLKAVRRVLGEASIHRATVQALHTTGFIQ